MAATTSSPALNFTQAEKNSLETALDRALSLGGTRIDGLSIAPIDSLDGIYKALKLSTTAGITFSDGSTQTTAAMGGGGVTTVGAFSGSSIANGASIASTTITFGPADGTNPGMVTTGSQTIAGAKTFSSVITSSVAASVNALQMNEGAILALNTGGTSFIRGDATSHGIVAYSNAADGSSAVGYQFNTSNTLANSSAKLMSVANGSTEVASFGLTGLNLSHTAPTITTANSTSVGLQINVAAASGQNAFLINQTTTRSAASVFKIQSAGNGVPLNLTDNGVLTISASVVANAAVLGGAALATSGNNTLDISGNKSDGSSAIAVQIRSNNSYTNATAKILSIQNLGTEKIAVNLNGKFVYPSSGSADVRGTATLSSGTVTVSTTAVKTGDHIFLSHAGTGTAANFGILYSSSIVDATSFVITSTNNSDNDTVNWWIVA